MSGPKPKKGLGQNFLADKAIARDIVQAINPEPDEVILEIGPGRGTLTVRLLECQAQVYAVEIDQRLLQPLEDKFGGDPRFHLLHGDFLRLPWEDMVPDQPFRLVGNLPYHITSGVLFRCIDAFRHQRQHQGSGNRRLKSLVLMVQKEVARRIVATPGSTDYSILSFFCALEGTVDIIVEVPARAFYPPPKVDGAVIRFIPHDRHHHIEDYTVLNTLVRGAFSARRKMLRNSLKTIAGIHPFWQQLDFDFSRRPETVTVREWVTLANDIANLRNRKGQAKPQ